MKYSLLSFLLFTCLIISYSQTPCVDNSQTGIFGVEVCAGTEAKVSLTNTVAGRTYKLYSGNKIVSDSAVGTTDGGNLTMWILPANLKVGDNLIYLRPTDQVCNTLAAGPGLVKVYPLPDLNAALVGDTICSQEDSAIVTIRNTFAGSIYQVTLDRWTGGTELVSKGGDMRVKIPRYMLKLGLNNISFTARGPACGPRMMTSSTYIAVHPFPESISMDTVLSICGTELGTELKVKGLPKGDTCSVWKQTLSLGKQIGNGDEIRFFIPLNALDSRYNELEVKAGVTSHGCQAAVVSRRVSLYANPGPPIAFDFKQDTVIVKEDAENLNLVFDASQESGNWRITDNGVPIGLSMMILIDTMSIPLRQEAPGYTFKLGTHHIKLAYLPFGCVKSTPVTDSVVVIVVPSILTDLEANIVSKESFKVSPNPFESELCFRFSAAYGAATLVITDALGKLVYSQEIDSATDFSIPSPWPSGTYYVEAKGANGNVRYKLIK